MKLSKKQIAAIAAIGGILAVGAVTASAVIFFKKRNSIHEKEKEGLREDPVASEKKINMIEVEENTETEKNTETDNIDDVTVIPIDKKDLKGIFLIDLDKFDTENEWYSKNVLTYYRGDGVLIDEKDDYISFDSDVLINNQHIIETLNGILTDCIYVRNDYLQADYEIVIDERTSEDVLGKIVNDINIVKEMSPEIMKKRQKEAKSNKDYEDALRYFNLI